MSTRPPVTIALVQDAVTGDPAQTLATTIGHVREAAANGARIICLKELFNAPYFCKSLKQEYFNLAEPIPGPTTNALSVVAAELEVVLVVPIYERQGPGVYRNSAAVIDADGALLGVYRKMHIPHDPMFEEKYYFAPGDAVNDGAGTASGFKVFKTRYATIGVLICWDQWYPEAARITALLGAEILFYPTNDSRARSRLRRYFKKNGLGKMWTLTNAEPCFDRALMHQRVNEFVQRWRHACNDEAFPYAYVLELHPQGHGLHVHFATRPGFVSWSQIGALWGHGFVQYSDNKRYAGEGGRERSRRLASYLCKYLDKSVGDNDRDEGEHRYEVGQGFDPVKVRRDFKSEKLARDWLAGYVGEKFEEVWCSDDREEWDGRPTWLFFSG